MFKLFSIRKEFRYRGRHGHDHRTSIRSTVRLFGIIPLFYYDIDGNSY